MSFDQRHFSVLVSLLMSQGLSIDKVAILIGYIYPLLPSGLEAARLRDWHVEILIDIRPKQMFFAYDTEDDYEPLVEAWRMLLGAGWTTTASGG
jgi:hypothetical protein